MMEPLLSVVMPVYNGCKFLDESISSVLRSTYGNIELLIVDDGSTDKSLDICRKYEASDNRVKVHSKRNEGIAATRNVGLNSARGEYVAFVDQDDRVEREAYGVLINRMSIDRSDMCVGNYSYLVHSLVIKKRRIANNFVSNGAKQYCAHLIGGKYLVDGSSFRDGAVPTTVWNCMYRMSVIRENRLQYVTFVDYEDDFLFNVRYLLNISRISFETSSVYCWRREGGSESSRHKYVRDLYSKRKRLEGYIKNVLAELGADRDTFLGVLQRRTLLWNLYNESANKDRHDAISSIRMCVENEDSAGISRYVYYDCTPTERVLLMMLLGRHTHMAYWANRCVFKKRFH